MSFWNPPVVRMQNTHWYRVGWNSFTSDPLFSSPEEVRRVGLHCCASIGCEEIHGGSAETYYYCQQLYEYLKAQEEDP